MSNESEQSRFKIAQKQLHNAKGEHSSRTRAFSSPLLPSGHHETAACADTQESAESWLFLALDLAEQKDHLYFMMDAQMNLACVCGHDEGQRGQGRGAAVTTSARLDRKLRTPGV